MTARGGMLVLASTLQLGGGERVLARLLLEIQSQGLPLSMVMLKEPGAVGEELAAAGVPVISFGLRSTRNPRVLCRLLSELKERAPSLLYVQDHHDCLFWGRLAAALSGFLPVISPVHSSSQGSLQAFRLYNRIVLGLSPNLVTLGSWQENALRENENLSAGFWVSIPNPVEAGVLLKTESRPDPERDLDKLVLGTVAALRREKRQDRLLALVAHLAPRLALELWIIGDGELRGDLERQAEDLGIADSVRFLGWRDDVSALLPQLDIFLLTSEEEAMPLSVLEAMRAGVPVAATAKGAIPDLLADGNRGLLLTGDDPAVWSGQLTRWLAKMPMSEQLSAWAGDVEEAYSLARFSRRYLRLLRHLGMD